MKTIIKTSCNNGHVIELEVKALIPSNLITCLTCGSLYINSSPGLEVTEREDN